MRFECIFILSLNLTSSVKNKTILKNEMYGGGGASILASIGQGLPANSKRAREKILQTIC